MSVLLDRAALVARLVTLQELFGQIVDEFGDLLRFPAVLALVVVDGELGTTEKRPDVLGEPANLSH